MKEKNVRVTTPAVWSVTNVNPEAAKRAKKAFEVKTFFSSAWDGGGKNVSEIKLLEPNDGTGQGSAGFTVSMIGY